MLLIVSTFFAAFGIIYLRKLKDTHYMVAPTYLTISSMVVGIITMSFMENAFEFFITLSWTDYIFTIFCGLLSAIG